MWEFLGLESERGNSVCWPNNKIIDGWEIWVKRAIVSPKWAIDRKQWHTPLTKYPTKTHDSEGPNISAAPPLLACHQLGAKWLAHWFRTNKYLYSVPELLRPGTFMVASLPQVRCACSSGYLSVSFWRGHTQSTNSTFVLHEHVRRDLRSSNRFCHFKLLISRGYGPNMHRDDRLQRFPSWVMTRTRQSNCSIWASFDEMPASWDDG